MTLPLVVGGAILGADGPASTVVVSAQEADVGNFLAIGITLLLGTGFTVTGVTDDNGNTWTLLDDNDNGTDYVAVFTTTVVTPGTCRVYVATAYTDEMITQIIELNAGVGVTWGFDGAAVVTTGTGTTLPYATQSVTYDDVRIAFTNAASGNPTVDDPNPYEGWDTENQQMCNYNVNVSPVTGTYTGVSGNQTYSNPWQTIQFLIYVASGGGASLPPLAPTLAYPSPGLAFDYAAGFDARYTYNPGTPPETGYQFRAKIGSGAYAYLDAGGGVWSGSPVTNPSLGGLIEVPAGLFVDGNTYDWSVASVDSAGVGPFAPDQTLVATAGPAVSASAVSVAVNPEIDWSVTFGGSGSQAQWRVVTYSAAQYSVGDFSPGSGPNLDDSGTQSDTSSSYVTTNPIPDGTVCRSYVFITQTPGLQVGVGSVDYTISNSSAPSVPDITASASTDPTTGVPSIAITVHDPNTTGDAAVGVVVIRDDGTSLANANFSTPYPITAGGTVTLYDLEISTDTGYAYEAYLVDASGVYSPPSAYTATTLISGATVATGSKPAFYMWIPSDPSTVCNLHLAIKSSDSAPVASGGDAVWVIDEPEDQGIFQPFGRKDSIVVRGDLRDEQFDLDLVFNGNDEWNAFKNMRRQQQTVALRSDMSATVGYYALGGTRPAAILRGDRLTNPIRQLKITFTPVLKPTVSP